MDVTSSLFQNPDCQSNFIDDNESIASLRGFVRQPDNLTRKFNEINEVDNLSLFQQDVSTTTATDLINQFAHKKDKKRVRDVEARDQDCDSLV